ncbi:MAG: bifunctional DNA-formamidopyrimidine glycosylase/DNA-(apurinic or apyrimidinic site) lyase [Candidatus Aminicenantes bacterium]|nr:bifunctional DNA-formamidopyrimidine glycosylase/DNA-(apurinic or apyrimidinic site) lyase [Candidatus Aminicenantes bacterium]
MPELPEVETIVRGLKARIIGWEVKEIIFLSNYLKNKYPENKKVLKHFRGKKVSAVSRRGKMIMVGLDGELHWLIHLKMTGQLYLARRNEPVDKHVHVRVIFKGQAEELRFRDVRKFGFWFCLKGPELKNKVCASLGPEPLALKYHDFVQLWQKYPARQAKSLLLDQKIIAGIGNIYSDEILFRAGIRPERRARTLKPEELRKIYFMMKQVLREAIAQKGSSISDYIDSYGERGEFQEKHRVYGKEGKRCQRCKRGFIRRQKIAGRSSYFCPVCQK